MLVLSSTYLQLLSPALLSIRHCLPSSSSWPQTCHFSGFFWTNPFPPGAEGVNVCLGPAAEVMQEKVVHRAHGRSITPVISTMSAANEHPSHDGLLTESSCIPGWPPQSCFSVGTRQYPFLRQFGVSILISFSRTKIVLALSEITWTAQKYTITSSGSHWQRCCPGPGLYQQHQLSYTLGNRVKLPELGGNTKWGGVVCCTQPPEGTRSKAETLFKRPPCGLLGFMHS